MQVSRDRGFSEQTVLSGMTDLLMTALAIIFILLLTVTIQTPFEAKEITEGIREELWEELQQRLQSGGQSMFADVQIGKASSDPLVLSVIVPQSLLGFRLNDASLPPDGERFLSQFIPILAHYACEDQAGLIESIVVEGHADSSGPNTRPDEYNIKLSQDRSMSVVKASLRILEGDERQFRCFLRLASASGRGSVDVIRDESGTELAKMSRRVVFKLRMKSLEQRVGTSGHS